MGSEPIPFLSLVEFFVRNTPYTFRFRISDLETMLGSYEHLKMFLGAYFHQFQSKKHV